MSNKRTPGPYWVEPENDDDYIQILAIENKSEETIAVIHAGDVRSIYQDHVNAIFIVKACNSHDRLVEALKEVAQHPHCKYPDKVGGDRQYDIGVTDGHRCAADIAREALREAGEEA